MRDNQPVTQQEYELPSESLLVSYTDLHGNITLANEAFVEASGYNYDELLGQPHNILRHPDVPEQVFFDLWRTIKDARPWNQIVKNRRKDGSHYWVEANTTPIIENDAIIGFMSVRTPATQAQIKQAEKAYAAIAKGAMKLRHGRPEEVSKRINPLPNINPPLTTVPTAIIAIIAFLVKIIDGSIPVWLEGLLVFMTLVASAHALYFVHQIKNAITAVDEIANGHLDKAINTEGENFGGIINRRIKTMQTRLNAANNDFVTAARKSARLESGLGNLNAYIMIADQNRTITYLNPSLGDFLKSVEEDFRTVLPHFSADNLVGKNIDIFHKNPQHQIKILDNLNQTYTAKIEVAGHSLQLVMSPIYDSQCNKIGTVVEWQDIFQELYVQDSIKQLVKDANAGKLDKRMKTNELDGFYLELANNFNSLMANLQNALEQMSYVISGLSNNDLTLVPSGQFEGEFKKTIDNLMNGINDLRLAFCKMDGQAGEVAKSAEQVKVSNQHLEDALNIQAEDMHTTAAAVEQLNQQVNETASKAQTSNELSNQTQTMVEKGSNAMQEAIQSMHEIEEVSERITGIVTLIDGIAFQTNLLALNAAVEAARAGEHGRGFAVVAGEVRTLSQKSAAAAKDIKDLIETTAQKISDGTQKVQSTGLILEDITLKTHEVGKNISDITLNAKEQAQAIGQISEAVLKVERTSHESHTLIHENASLATYLGHVSDDMGELVDHFELGDCNQEALLAIENTNKVLVVDDTLPNAKVAEALLKKLGYHVDIADNGRTAVNMASNEEYDFILMDIAMPELNGYEATARIRNGGYTAPIYAYTALDDAASHAEIKRSGMNEILQKPVTIEKLKEIISV